MLSMPAFVTKSHKACTDPGRLTHESEFKLLDITSEVTHPSLTTRQSLPHLKLLPILCNLDLVAEIGRNRGSNAPSRNSSYRQTVKTRAAKRLPLSPRRRSLQDATLPTPEDHLGFELILAPLGASFQHLK